MSQFDLITVSHRSELAMLSLQARSLCRFVPAHLIGTIHVINNEPEPAAFKEAFQSRVLPEYGQLKPKVWLRERDDFLPNSAWVHGWRSQQVLKFLVAQSVRTEWTLILDTKNHFVRPVSDGAYIDKAGRLLIWLISQRGHLQPIFDNSFRYFSLDPEIYVDSSLPNITPFPVRPSTLRDLIALIEKQESCSFGQFFLHSGHQFAEFYLLAAYILKRDGTFTKEYAFRPREVVTLFPDKADPGAFESVMWQLDRDASLAFGIHWNALPKLTQAMKGRIAEAWLEFGLIEDLMDAREFLG
jgi:hypothetical protein